jgi:aryl-alcohol dehydrogenase-like predicted oxidoreductase
VTTAEENAMTESTMVLGALSFGTRVDETDSMRLLDQFVDLGGTWIDTANNYSYWIDPSGTGGQSETVIGRWLAKRPGMRDRVRISTKAGANRSGPAGHPGAAEGLSRPAISAAFRQSLERLQTERVDLFWAHAEDRSVALEETVETLGELVDAGLVGRLGASNHPAWRVERARVIARDRGVTGYSMLQLRWSYLLPRPGAALPDTGHRHASAETFDYLASTDGLELWAYNTLLNGAYTRADRPLAEAYDHPGNARRLAALDAVAGELGVTRNQVVLAWLCGAATPVSPIVGVTTPAQVSEAMAAQHLRLTPDQRAHLDAAN